MTSRSRVGVRVAALSLTLGLLGACSGGGADQEAAQTVPPAPTSRPDSEHLLLHGTVTRDGEPLRDAEVSIHLDPEDLSDVEVGDTVDTLEAATATTDERGGYRLEVDPDELGSRYFNGDFLNVSFYVRDGDDLLTWGTTAHVVREQYWRSDEQALVGDPALRIDADLDEESLTTTDSRGGTTEDEAVLIDLSS